MAKKSIKIRNKRYKINNVENVAESVPDLLALNYAKPFSDSVALINPVKHEIIMSDALKGKERESVLFHELIHITLPKLSERDVLTVERTLFPVLHKFGLRFNK